MPVADALADAETFLGFTGNMAPVWGVRVVRFGIARMSPFQSYWRTVLAARAAFRAVPALRGEA